MEQTFSANSMRTTNVPIFYLLMNLQKNYNIGHNITVIELI